MQAHLKLDFLVSVRLHYSYLIQNISRDSETDVGEKTQVLQKNKQKKHRKRTTE